MRTMTKMFLSAGLLLCSITLKVSAAQTNGVTQYVWCWTAPLRPEMHRFFYSSIFQVDSSQLGAARDAFGSWVRQGWPEPTGVGECLGYNSEAGADESRQKTIALHNEAQIIDTEWRYIGNNRQVYWVCWSFVDAPGEPELSYVSKVFSKPTTGPAAGDTETFVGGLRAWADSKFGHRQPSGGNCSFFNTPEEANTQRAKFLKQEAWNKPQALDWPPNEQP
jgi:hypothetical protein